MVKKTQNPSFSIQLLFTKNDSPRTRRTTTPTLYERSKDAANAEVPRLTLCKRDISSTNEEVNRVNPSQMQMRCREREEGYFSNRTQENTPKHKITK